MKRRFKLSIWSFPVLAALLTATVVVAQQLPPIPPAGSQEDAEDAEVQPQGEVDGVNVQTRGPLHEAFARPYATDPEPGIVIREKPPEPIEELPPEQKPEGDNVIWIPGYWAGDEETDGFLWISGMWRDVPPERAWVSGYWTKVEDGWQWIAGFWTSAEEEELRYLDKPPKSLEAGPSSPASSADHFWVPGCWRWRDTKFAWGPGRWAVAQEGWVWVPAHYVWTPRGCIFVDGYWDYELADRGLLFAPVSFERDVYQARGYHYSPSVTLAVRPLVMHLFIRPDYHHYYFGDYYGDEYQKRYGIRPWAAYFSGGRRHDPLLTYYGWRFRSQGVDFGERMQSWHTYFASHEDARPPRFQRDQRAFKNRHQKAEWAQFALLSRPLNELVKDRESGRRFTSLNAERRREFSRTAADFRDFTKQRAGFEANLTSDARSRPDDRSKPTDDAEAGDRAGRGAANALKLPGRRGSRTADDARARDGQARTGDRDADRRKSPPEDSKPAPRRRPAGSDDAPDKSRGDNPPSARSRTPQEPEENLRRPGAEDRGRRVPPRADQPADEKSPRTPRSEKPAAERRPRGDAPQSKGRPRRSDGPDAFPRPPKAAGSGKTGGSGEKDRKPRAPAKNP